MGKMLMELDSTTTAVALGIAMLVGWSLGWWRGKVLRGRQRESSGHTFHDAMLALLGLLLGFTFSISLAKHDQRRQMVITDSNSIGDFLTCVNLLKEPWRGQLSQEIRAYIEIRLALAKKEWQEADLERKLADIESMHGRMQEILRLAIDGGTPVTVPLVNTFNEVTSSHAARLAAARDRLPLNIVLVLCLAATLAMVLNGVRQGEGGERSLGATLGFIFLVCLIIQVTMDLNQPQRGFIRVSQEPLERLLKGMGQ